MDSCYLCGKPIRNDGTADHVPPKQFFARSVRAFNLSQLVTLPAHDACNKSYSQDEEYVTWSLAPLALETPAGGALARDNAQKFRQGKSAGLGYKTLKEFEENPSGLHLPRRLVVKRVDFDRVRRVVWKIVRGLYRVEIGEVLPETTPFMYEVFEPENAASSVQNEVWELVKAQPMKGTYSGVFAYKYLFGEDQGVRLHVSGLLLWDAIMVFVAHHHPGDAYSAQASPANGEQPPD